MKTDQAIRELGFALQDGFHLLIPHSTQVYGVSSWWACGFLRVSPHQSRFALPKARLCRLQRFPKRFPPGILGRRSIFLKPAGWTSSVNEGGQRGRTAYLRQIGLETKNNIDGLSRNSTRSRSLKRPNCWQTHGASGSMVCASFTRLRASLPMDWGCCAAMFPFSTHHAPASPKPWRSWKG